MIVYCITSFNRTDTLLTVKSYYDTVYRVNNDDDRDSLPRIPVNLTWLNFEPIIDNRKHGQSNVAADTQLPELNTYNIIVPTMPSMSIPEDNSTILNIELEMNTTSHCCKRRLKKLLKKQRILQRRERKDSLNITVAERELEPHSIIFVPTSQELLTQDNDRTTLPLTTMYYSTKTLQYKQYISQSCYLEVRNSLPQPADHPCFDDSPPKKIERKENYKPFEGMYK